MEKPAPWQDCLSLWQDRLSRPLRRPLRTRARSRRSCLLGWAQGLASSLFKRESPSPGEKCAGISGGLEEVDESGEVKCSSAAATTSRTPLARTCRAPELTGAPSAPDSSRRRRLPRLRSSFRVAERASSGTSAHGDGATRGRQSATAAGAREKPKSPRAGTRGARRQRQLRGWPPGST
jgi:hypothetical protein